MTSTSLLKKPSMNDDIRKFGVYIIINGKLVKTNRIKTTDDYNHYTHNIHHYIKSSKYFKNQDWYKQRGIKQKLILMTIRMHEDLEIYPISDEEFFQKYKIERKELLFNKKWSEY